MCVGGFGGIDVGLDGRLAWHVDDDDCHDGRLSRIVFVEELVFVATWWIIDDDWRMTLPF